MNGQQQEGAPPRMFSDQISYSADSVEAIVLTKQLSIGNQSAEQQNFLVVAVQLPPALRPMSAPGAPNPHMLAATKTEICKQRTGGLEYSRRGQEVVLRLLRPRQSASVDVPTATLFTKVLKVGMLTVAIAHMRRSPLPMSAAPPASEALQAAPNVHNAFVESAVVSVYHGQNRMEFFDLADRFKDQTFEVLLSPDGARLHHTTQSPCYKVQLQHVSSPQPLLVERFNPAYMSIFKEVTEDVWLRALMRARQQAMQQEAAVQAAATRERKRAWACVVQQACAVAGDFKHRSKAMKAMSKARPKQNADRS